MALARWRQTRLWKLETSIINVEISRLRSLTPNEDAVSLMALAFRSLIDHGCSLQIINRLESRCERQYDRAVDRLTALRARGIFEKINIHERPQQVIENTWPYSAQTHSATMDAADSQSAGNPNLKKAILHARTQQAVENTPPHPEPTHQTARANVSATARN
jgi:hypothetical protein